MDESIQKAVLHCVFRVFPISRDTVGDTKDSLAMAFAKFSERGSAPALGGCYQLLLAPLPKIANGCGVALCRE
jgi:hypothetical protein